MAAFSGYLKPAAQFFKTAFFAGASIILVNDKAIDVISVNGDSMSPTLCPTYHETGQCDTLLVNKWNPTKNLQRGDVVVFHTPHKPETMAIKRVIALEGDWIQLDWRRRDRDEKEGDGKTAVIWDAVGEDRVCEVGRRRVKVPVGHVWVEGDNMRKSRDSNGYGPISKSLIMGKAMSVVYPFARFGSKPWEGYQVKTKVKKAQNYVPIGWENLR